MLKNKRTYLIPIVGFALIILVGAILLYLPVCNYKPITFRNALYTATSGLTTTGFTKLALVSQFNFWGQLVLAILMEIGAMGFIIFISYFWSIKNKKIRMSDIIIINDNISSDSYATIKQHSIFIFKLMLKVQTIGTILLAIKFIPLMGFFKGIWYSIFHAISAFSNTGFDLFYGDSLYIFKNDIYVQIILMCIMILGSIGILVIEDLMNNHFRRFNRLKLQTKIVLTYSIGLLLVPAILIFMWEPNVSILNSLFMSTTTRSTGFSVVDIQNFGMNTKIILIIAMFIGGSPTSTAGGVRIVPIAIIIATVLSTLEGKNDTVIFWRKISDLNIKKAFTILMVFLVILFISTIILANYSNVSVLNIIFTSVSAITNTGLSTIDINEFNIVQENIIMLLMYVGRVGPLSLVLAFVGENKKDKYIEYPTENVML